MEETLDELVQALVDSKDHSTHPDAKVVLDGDGTEILAKIHNLPWAQEQQRKRSVIAELMQQKAKYELN